MNHFTYFIARIVIGAIRRLPLIICFRCGQLLGWIAWLLLPGYRRLAKKNLQVAFGKKYSPAEISTWARKSFLLLGANIFCSLKIPAMSDAALRKVFTIEGEEHWDTYFVHQKNRGTVAALSHFGNWELNAHIATLIPTRRSGAVYQPLRNRLIDDLINRDRRSRGVATFDRKRDLPAAITMLREGGILGVLTDQHAGDAGQWIPFFNKLASTSPLAATLAQKTGAALVPVTIHTVAPARWAVHVHKAIPTADRDIADITFDVGEALTEEIRSSPADWFWVHNRWKLPNPAFLLTRTKRGFFLPDSLSTKDLQPLKLLVRSPNWLGDACMAAPAIRSLKLGRPDLHLTILTPAKLADVWKLFPEVDDIIIIPQNASPWEVAKLLRQKTISSLLPAFDAALLIPNSVRSALEVWLAGIPRRIGRVGEKGRARKWLINQPFPKEKETALPLHEADEYAAIARWLGAPDARGQAIIFDKKTSPLSQFPRAHFVNNNSLTPCWRIAIAPGAEYGPAKRWPADRFRSVMEQLSVTHDISWTIVGTAAERSIAITIADGFQGAVDNKAGQTTLAELINILQQVDLLVTNDTGTMHLADVLEIPTVSIFGSTDPVRTGPRGPQHHVLQHAVSCSPCFLRQCPIDFRCMLGVTPEHVVQACNTILNNRLL